MRKTTKKRQNKKNKTRFRLKGGASYSGRILLGAMTEYPYCDIFVHTFRSILYSIFSKSAYNAYEFSSAFDDLIESIPLLEKNGSPFNIKLTTKDNKRFSPDFNKFKGHFVDSFSPINTKYNINCGKKIGGGTYSSIYNCKINNIKTIIKVPIEPLLTPNKVALNNNYIKSFFMEQFIHSELYCIQSSLDCPNEPCALIPSIHLICKYKNNSTYTYKIDSEVVHEPLGDYWKFILGIEPLDDDLHSWIHKNKHKSGFVSNFIVMIRSICNLLIKLQDNCNFYHRDFHPNNIMCKQNIDGTYVWYIIDFGMATLKHNNKQIQPIIKGIYDKEDMYDISKTPNVFINNHGHDLRILFLSIFGNTELLEIIKSENNDLGDYFKSLHDSIIDDLIEYDCWDSSQPIHFNGYFNAYSKICIDTNPREVLSKLNLYDVPENTFKPVYTNKSNVDELTKTIEYLEKEVETTKKAAVEARIRAMNAKNEYNKLKSKK